MERPSRAAYAAPWFEKAIASVASAIDGAAPNNPAKLLGRKRSPRTAKAETANPPMKKRMRYSITPFPLLCFHKGPRFTKPHERLYTFPGVLTAAREPSRSRTHGRDNFCQYFCATDRGPRMLQRRREALQHAFFKCSDHRFVHIAFAADRGGIGELIGGCGHRGANLPAALPLARRGLHARKRFEHSRRCKKGAKVLQRDACAGHLAQARVHLMRSQCA